MLNAYFFIRTDHTNADGTNTIYLRITQGRRKKDIATPVRTKLKHWNSTKQRISTRDWDSYNKNKILDSIITRAKEIIYQAYIEGKELTIDEFLSLFRTKSTKHDFYNFCKNEIEKSELSPQTRKTYLTQLTKLQKFSPSLAIEDINLDFLQRYQTYMQFTLGNNTNTISKTFRFLRNMLNRAKRYGIIKENPLNQIKIKETQGNRQYLTKEEIYRLKHYYTNTTNLRHKKVLRYFLFNCYVGLRYTDLKNLKWKHLQTIEIDGKTHIYVQIQMHKTRRDVIIPVPEPALEFLPERPQLDELPVFRVYTNQVTNRYLKEIAQATGINKTLTTHVTRHTFATLAIDAGIPIEVVSELLGHTQIKTTQIYAKISLSKKFKEVEKLSKL